MHTKIYERTISFIARFLQGILREETFSKLTEIDIIRYGRKVGTIISKKQNEIGKKTTPPKSINIE